ncbi:tumor necrosis factor receptor superfamily member 1B-like [Protopterus annectens]|uniref:tumor necrosis factor receptor superfamily member 1B-like n=1 Tax=Protopterus annectens TaxID=7888 RepID=UPI001CFB2EAF|nr:tumor necrosis factor receptor superfamily member 1B-like [Protopterus annectens]
MEEKPHQRHRRNVVPETGLCANMTSHFFHPTERKCCYSCPKDHVGLKSCPKSIDECKSCEPDQYLSNHIKPVCMACVKCREEEDLVEKTPCSINSQRTCVCRDGMFCESPKQGVCLRCSHHTACAPGYGVKHKGTHDSDTKCEVCPPGTFSSNYSTHELCKSFTNCSAINKRSVNQGTSTTDEICEDDVEKTDVTKHLLTPRPTNIQTVYTTTSNKQTTVDILTLPNRTRTGGWTSTTSLAFLSTLDYINKHTSKTVSQQIFHMTTVVTPTNRPSLLDHWILLILLTACLCAAVVITTASFLFWKTRICKKWIFCLKDHSFVVVDEMQQALRQSQLPGDIDEIHS